MRRHAYVILFLLIAALWGVCGSYSCVIGHAANDYGTVIETGNASNSPEHQIDYVIADPNCALPVQIQKIQSRVIQLSEHQNLKRISETIFGHNANILTTHCITQRITRSQHISLNLETYDIGFQFSAFW